MTLLLDGLDESVFFARSGGVALLFNLLMDVRIPIILTARSEFWLARQADLFTLDVAAERRADPPKRAAVLLELLPWGKTQIIECIDRRLRVQTDPARRRNLEELSLAVEREQLGAFYRDVPSRPLFLRYIIETAEVDGLQQMGPAALFWRWLELKIERDYRRPLQQGGSGRASLSQSAQSLSQIGPLALLAMRHAARLMAVAGPSDGDAASVGLVSSCSYEDLQRSDPRLGDLDDPAGLALFTLLRSTHPLTGFAVPLLEFAHRSYQEYFTALDVLCSADGSSRIGGYPQEVVA